MTGALIDRFDDPLYTNAEAARFLGVPEPTLQRWSTQTPLVTSIPGVRGRASIPFVGLAEAYTLHTFRALGVPLQRIRPAIERLSAEMGVAHALASKRMYTDGAEVLYEYDRSQGGDGLSDLVVVRSQQPVFRDVVTDYLRRVEFADGYAQRLPLTGYGDADLFVDQAHSFGQPVFAHGGARLADALDLFRAGEPLVTVAEEFGVPAAQLEAAVRASLPAAA